LERAWIALLRDKFPDVAWVIQPTIEPRTADAIEPEAPEGAE
jgi:hypothetical protein